MSHFNQHKQMIALVANALGEELIAKTAFVGGCTTGLLITDDMTRESVRYTDDVDLIVNVMGYAGWHKFSGLLQERGFTVSIGDTVNCRFRLGTLQVDFMPDDPHVLGFSNRWYKDALNCAIDYKITATTTIRLVTPPYFLATKIEAYKGRGDGDLLSSHDIEDLLNLVDGRVELVEELINSPAPLRDYLSQAMNTLLLQRDMLYAVQSATTGDAGRQQLLFERLKMIADMGTRS